MLALALLLATTSPGSAGASTVSAETQARNFLRVITYDRNFDRRFDYEITIAGLYDPANTASKTGAQAFLQAIDAQGGEAIGKKLKTTLLPFEGATALEKTLGDEHVRVIFVAEGLEPATEAITECTRRRQIVSVGATREEVEKGLSFGVVDAGGKAGLLVNMAASKAEGIRFKAQLLRIAEVLR